jgi:cell division protein FtsN
MIAQRGGFAMGLVTGLLVGLALALAVALYITKAPVPFINKVPQRTAEQDSAETERNRNWDPNAGLAGRTAARAASATAAGVAAAAASAAGLPAPGAAAGPTSLPPQPPTAAASRAQARDPAAILAGQAGASAPRSTTSAAEPFIYFVQAGAYTRNEDAEQQRARLAMIGQGARITEREQAGRTVYRVRLGPWPTRAEAESLQLRLQEQGIEAQIVRVEKS